MYAINIIVFFCYDSDIVFSLAIGTKLTRSELASLARSEPILPSVIDAWAEVLNCEEQYRNQTSLRRRFFTHKLW